MSSFENRNQQDSRVIVTQGCYPEILDEERTNFLASNEESKYSMFEYTTNHSRIIDVMDPHFDFYDGLDS